MRFTRFAAIIAAAALAGCATFHPAPTPGFTTDSGGRVHYRFGIRYGSTGAGGALLVDCVAATSTACNATSNPGNGTQGMPAWEAFGTLNQDNLNLYGMFPATVGLLFGNGLVPHSMTAVAPTATGIWCFSWASTTAAPTLVSCPSGSGTVTSVSITVPSWLTVSGSPVTTSGTFAVTATTGQTQNEFLATPCGSSGAVGLRVICSSDFPTSGVTAGSYTSANITVDATGRVTSATNGSGSGITLQTNGTNNSSQTSQNIESGSAVDGIAPTATNTSGGNVQLGISISPANLQASLIANNAQTYSPTLASGVTNDWDPSGGVGIATVGFVDVTPNSAGSTVDGVLAGSDKQQFILCDSEASGNNGYYVILESQSSSDTTAANRMWIAGNEVLGPQMCVTFTYIAGSVTRWLVSSVWNARTGSTQPLSSAASMTPDCSFKFITETASQSAFTVNAPTDCTPQNGQLMELDVTNFTTANAYTWNAAYVGNTTVSLPAVGGAASKLDRFAFAWDAANSTWDLKAYALGR